MASHGHKQSISFPAGFRQLAPRPGHVASFPGACGQRGQRDGQRVRWECIYMHVDIICQFFGDLVSLNIVSI